MALKIVAERKEGFTAPIGLQMVFNPPGITSQRGVNIPKDKNEATISLNANGGAQVRAWKIAVNGSSGGIWASTQLASLRVAEPYIDLAAEKSSVEQGQATEIYCFFRSRASAEFPSAGRSPFELLYAHVLAEAGERARAAHSGSVDAGGRLHRRERVRRRSAHRGPSTPG